ncbi:MAG TPA: hypothetical protein VGJ60_20485 [Chloroflexota bacterium]
MFDSAAEREFSRRVTRKLEEQRKAAQKARTARHADQDAHIHRSLGGTGDAHIDHLAELGSMEPGSAEFRAKHLVGSMAPEEVIEVMGPIGPEGFGITRRLDGVTGELLDTPRIYLPGGSG